MLILTLDLGMAPPGPQILMTAPHLPEEGLDVTVAALRNWGILGEELGSRGIRAVAFGAARSLDLRAAGRMVSFVRRERVEILHSHHEAANSWARILGRSAGVPVVITSHLDAVATAGWFRRSVERMTAPMSDAVVTWSEAVRNRIRRRLRLRPGQIRALCPAVMPVGASASASERESLRREVDACPGDLLVGADLRLDARGGSPAMLPEALPMLARDVQQARFVILGEGRDRVRLEANASTAGLDGRMTFTADPLDLRRWLPALDLYVQPAVEGSAVFTILEAMAAGLPVVCMRAADAPGIVLDGESGILVSRADPSALAGACATVLRDPELRGRLGRSAGERAAKVFPVDGLVRETAALYRQLLERRSGDAFRPRLPGSRAA